MRDVCHYKGPQSLSRLLRWRCTVTRMSLSNPITVGSSWLLLLAQKPCPGFPLVCSVSSYLRTGRRYISEIFARLKHKSSKLINSSLQHLHVKTPLLPTMFLKRNQ